jgi:two-component system, response regulator PdtaR
MFRSRLERAVGAPVISSTEELPSVRHRTENMAEKNRVILVAEDEVLLRMMAVESFKDMGFHVLEAGCGLEALDIARERNELWALFTDVEMPGDINGVVLAHRVRMKFPNIRVILCSGRTLPSKNELPERARFLAKPYQLDDLQFCISDGETDEA